jgi:DNA polymerase III subunit epsilon
MEKKVLYFDTETTGLKHWENEIVQLAGIVEVDGEVKEKFNIYLRPDKLDKIEQEALDIQGKTKEEILAYPDRRSGFNEFLALLDRHIDKYNKLDKFIVAGQNIRFDMGFVRAFFKNMGHSYFGSYFGGEELDSRLLYIALMLASRVDKLTKMRLTNICSALGVDLENAHDAMADIQATYDILQIMLKMIER